MELEIQIFSVAIAVGVFGFGIAVYCYIRQRNFTKFLAASGEEFEALAETLAKIKESSEQNSRRLSEQSRHIAWLETRIRQPKLLQEDVLQDESIHTTPKATMTERRHRVITLASRGQNSESIASALGMLQGEVELIMSLNRASARYKVI